MINSLPTILLCFEWMTRHKGCRSLTRRNDGPLSDIKDFVFDAEFEVNKVAIPNSAYPHWLATIANYFGLPLILGGSTGKNKLEMLNTMESPPSWIELEDYPYSNISGYAVASTRNSVIYFGGYSSEEGVVDRVAEFKNLQWNLLGHLAGSRYSHHSIKMRNKIYLFPGLGAWKISKYKFFILIRLNN